MGRAEGREDRRQHRPGGRPRDRARAVRVAQLRQRLARRVRHPACPRQKGSEWEYFHANAIDIDNDGNFLVSARNTSTIYKINRATGKIMWRLGGKKSTSSSARACSFDWQHSIRAQPDGTYKLYDNEAAPPVAQDVARAHAQARRAGQDRDAGERVHAPAQAALRQPGQRRAPAQRQRVRRLGLAALVHGVQPDRRGALRRSHRARATTTTARSATSGPGAPAQAPKVVAARAAATSPAASAGTGRRDRALGAARRRGRGVAGAGRLEGLGGLRDRRHREVERRARRDARLRRRGQRGRHERAGQARQVATRGRRAARSRCPPIRPRRRPAWPRAGRRRRRCRGRG